MLTESIQLPSIREYFPLEISSMLQNVMDEVKKQHGKGYIQNFQTISY